MYRQLCIKLTLLFIASLFSYKGVTAQCNNLKLLTCMEPLLNLLKTAQETLPLPELCRELSIATQCAKNNGCPDNDEFVVSVWLGLRDAFQLMCDDETFRDVFTNNLCLKSASVSQQLAGCNRVFLAALTSNNSDACLVTDTFLNCVEDATTGCGTRVSRVYVTFAYTLVNPRSVQQGCRIRKPDMVSSPTTSTPSISSAVISTPLILLLAALLGTIFTEI